MATETTIKERPILFSGEMVRAILAGRKTQTRRVITEEWNHRYQASESYPYTKRPLRRESGKDDFVYRSEPYTEIMGEPVWMYSWGNSRWLRCRFGWPGERLWVRETWCECGDTARYRADGKEIKSFVSSNDPADYRWRPSIHMPRRASRITLEITDVRAQRLQEISEADARAEGAEKQFRVSVMQPGVSDHKIPNSHLGGFVNLWQSINANRGFSWESNPWVWAITFRKP